MCFVACTYVSSHTELSMVTAATANAINNTTNDQLNTTNNDNVSENNGIKCSFDSWSDSAHSFIDARSTASLGTGWICLQHAEVDKENFDPAQPRNRSNRVALKERYTWFTYIIHIPVYMWCVCSTYTSSRREPPGLW